MMHNPTAQDWQTADELWTLIQEIEPAKARTIFTAIVAATPQTLEQARNVVKDAQSLRS